MADTRTTHIGLIKQDPDTKPDYAKDDANLDKLDAEIWKRGQKFNGQNVDANGEFVIRSIPYADNLETSSSQKSNEAYTARTSGGEASIEDGDAWLTVLKGQYKHTGYVAQEINMTVTPMTRTPDPAITATLDEETFEAYVQEAGTYTVSYDGEEWDTSPTLYGLTVSNTPIEGDSITMVWDGEEDAVVTVNAATRPTPESISATIDEDVFVAYVENSGTTTLTYSTAWSADPTLYGITVTGTPIAGDVITVVYVKEVRGLITQSDPQKFISTGWNLYNHAQGYAQVLKYSNEQGYGFKIAGTYTALEFATTVSGSRTTITPVSGYFAIPSDGYVFVTGGTATDTEIWMTWSDWGTTPNHGDGFEAYEEFDIDLAGYMAYRFPYGLMAVNNIQDEININTGVATSRVTRMAYNETNLANAKASGRSYEYDEDYIYIERETPVTYDTTWEDSTGGTTVTRTLDGAYTANDHGMEFFTGTGCDVYAETIYGANLKNKLERDTVTISQQTLTEAQKTQICQNLGISRTTLRDVPFAVAVADWSGSGSSWTANFLSAYITTTCKWILVYDSSIASYAKAHLNANLKSGGGGLTITSTKKPTGTITGTILVFDNDDGKLPTLIENTVVSIANGGTGQSSLAGAKQALGIQDLADQIGTLNSNLNPSSFTVPTAGTGVTLSTGGYVKIGKIVIVNIRCSTTGSATTLFTGLPVPKNKDASNVARLVIACSTTNASVPVSITGAGNIVSDTAVAQTSALVITACYVCE